MPMPLGKKRSGSVSRHAAISRQFTRPWTGSTSRLLTRQTLDTGPCQSMPCVWTVGEVPTPRREGQTECAATTGSRRSLKVSQSGRVASHSCASASELNEPHHRSQQYTCTVTTCVAGCALISISTPYVTSCLLREMDSQTSDAGHLRFNERTATQRRQSASETVRVQRR